MSILTRHQGAAAILEYNALSSPLAQPRNAFFGHIISAIIGVGIAKATFPPISSQSDTSALSSTGNAWLLAPLACGLSSAAMSLTGTIHPPGGATAVLAVTDVGLRQLGWSLIPLVAVASVIMLGVACLGGNVLRRYPLYWWSLRETGACWTSKINEVKQTERSDSLGSVGSIALSVEEDRKDDSKISTVTVSLRGVMLPPALALDQTEIDVLEGIKAKLKDRQVKATDFV
jgi:hypothetical protein